MTNKERFLKLVSPEKTDTMYKNKQRIKYRRLLRIIHWLQFQLIDFKEYLLK